MKAHFKVCCNYNTVEYDVDVPEDGVRDEDTFNRLKIIAKSMYAVLGSIPAVKPAPSAPKEQPATAAQLARLKQMGIPFDKNITKQGAWKMINSLSKEAGNDYEPPAELPF